MTVARDEHYLCYMCFAHDCTRATWMFVLASIVGDRKSTIFRGGSPWVAFLLPPPPMPRPSSRWVMSSTTPRPLSSGVADGCGDTGTKGPPPALDCRLAAATRIAALSPNLRPSSSCMLFSDSPNTAVSQSNASSFSIFIVLLLSWNWSARADRKSIFSTEKQETETDACARALYHWSNARVPSLTPSSSHASHFHSPFLPPLPRSPPLPPVSALSCSLFLYYTHLASVKQTHHQPPPLPHPLYPPYTQHTPRPPISLPYRLALPFIHHQIKLS